MRLHAFILLEGLFLRKTTPEMQVLLHPTIMCSCECSLELPEFRIILLYPPNQCTSLTGALYSWEDVWVRHSAPERLLTHAVVQSVTAVDTSDHSCLYWATVIGPSTMWSLWPIKVITYSLVKKGHEWHPLTVALFTLLSLWLVTVIAEYRANHSDPVLCDGCGQSPQSLWLTMNHEWKPSITVNDCIITVISNHSV